MLGIKYIYQSGRFTELPMDNAYSINDQGQVMGSHRFTERGISHPALVAGFSLWINSVICLFSLALSLLMDYLSTNCRVFRMSVFLRSAWGKICNFTPAVFITYN